MCLHMEFLTKNNSLYESYDESVYRPMREKFAYITHLISDALKLKNEVRKLTNHPMNTHLGHILIYLKQLTTLVLRLGMQKRFLNSVMISKEQDIKT